MCSPVDLQRVHTVLALNAVLSRVSRLADQTPVFVPEQGDETLTSMQRRTELCLVPRLAPLPLPSGSDDTASAGVTPRATGGERRWGSWGTPGAHSP